MDYNHFKVLGFFAAGFLLVQGIAHAETMHGQIESVSPASQSVQIKGQDTGNTREFFLKSGTKLSGIGSLNELNPGDAVKIEGFQANRGRWEGSSLTLEARGNHALDTSGAGMTVVHGNPNTFPGETRSA